MYYLGIDGGGTHSRLIAVSEDNEVLGSFTGGSTNLASNPYNVVQDNIDVLIKGCLEQIGSKLEDCKGFCIGSAGIDIPEDVETMSKLLREIGVNVPTKIVNDAELILAAGTKGEAGIGIISGTGSIGFAVDRADKMSRSGGWGYLIDDGGSGYFIGMQAIKYSLMSSDGRLPETKLAEKICKHFELNNIEEVLTVVYSEHFNKSKIAALGLLVAEAARENDEIAIRIEREAAYELYTLVKALAERSGLRDCKIILSGSVLLNNGNIRQAFSELVQKLNMGFDIEILSEKAEMGAIYLARKAV